MNERLYHVYMHNVRLKSKVRVTAQPLPLDQAAAAMARVTPYSWRRTTMEEADVEALA